MTSAEHDARGRLLVARRTGTLVQLVTTVVMSRYLTKVAENAVGTHDRVHVVGIPIAPGSLFVFDVSACTVLLVVLMPVVGAAADRSGRKRDIMLGFGWQGAAAIRNLRR